MARFFISHSSKDIEVVYAFVDWILELGLDLHRDAIFCSSIEDMGIKSGDDFRTEIIEKLITSECVVQIISEDYKKSEVCLNEMGAAWAMRDKKVIAFLLGDITFANVGFIHAFDQLLRLDSTTDLTRFRDEIFGEDKLRASGLNRQVKQFVENLPLLHAKKTQIQQYDEAARARNHLKKYAVLESNEAGIVNFLRELSYNAKITQRDHPLSIMLSGPPGCGKAQLASEIITRFLYSTKIISLDSCKIITPKTFESSIEYGNDRFKLNQDLLQMKGGVIVFEDFKVNQRGAATVMGILQKLIEHFDRKTCIIFAGHFQDISKVISEYDLPILISEANTITLRPPNSETLVKAFKEYAKEHDMYVTPRAKVALKDYFMMVRYAKLLRKLYKNGKPTVLKGVQFENAREIPRLFNSVQDWTKAKSEISENDIRSCEQFFQVLEEFTILLEQYTAARIRLVEHIRGNR